MVKHWYKTQKGVVNDWQTMSPWEPNESSHCILPQQCQSFCQCSFTSVTCNSHFDHTQLPWICHVCTLFFLHICQLFNSNPFYHATAMVLLYTLPFQNQVFTRTILPFNCHPLVIHFPFHNQFFTISRQVGAVAAHGTKHVWLNNAECEPKINWINSRD